MEQEALDAVYRLGGTEAARAYVQRGIVVRGRLCRRAYACPRCEGHGYDPEHTQGGSVGGWGDPVPPEPCECELCGGTGVVCFEPSLAAAGAYDALKRALTEARIDTAKDVSSLFNVIVDPNAPEDRAYLVGDRADALAFALKGLGK